MGTSLSRIQGSDAAERLWWPPGRPSALQTLVSCCGSSNHINWPYRLCQRRTSRLCMPLQRRAAPQRAPRDGLRTKHSPGVPLRCILLPVPDREVSLPPTWPLRCCRCKKRCVGSAGLRPAALGRRHPDLVLTYAYPRPAARLLARTHAYDVATYAGTFKLALFSLAARRSKWC